MFAEYNDYIAYIKDVVHYNRTPDEEAQLLARYRETHDENAREMYISAQLYWIARTVYKHYYTSGMLMELIQNANMQLLHLFESYDETKSKFRTYAEPLIIKEADTYRMRFSHTVTVSTNAIKLSKRLRDMRDKALAGGKSQEEAIGEVAAFFVSKERNADFAELDEVDRAAVLDTVQCLIDLSKPDVSLDAPLGDGDDEAFTLMTSLSDEKDAPDHNVIAAEEKALLLDAIKSLTSKQRYVLVRAYGLYGHVPMRTVEIADALGISRQRVNVILNGAVDKLREYIQGRS